MEFSPEEVREVALPGESSNSLLYLLAARLKEPHMPPNGGKIADPKLALIKLWIDQGLLPTASGKPMVKRSPRSTWRSVRLPWENRKASAHARVFVPRTQRGFKPGLCPLRHGDRPLVTDRCGRRTKQVLLYHTETLRLLGILPFPEGFIESLSFSRNGKIVLASGGRGGKSGRVAGWDLKTGKRY